MDTTDQGDRKGQERARAIFFEIFSGLPQQGPGDDVSTRLALQMLPALPQGARVLDVGCGTGRQTLALAQALLEAPKTPGRDRGITITAVDNHPPYVTELRRQLEQRGLERWVRAEAGDMSRLSFDEGTLDLIWSEGAIYILGFEVGLRAWRPLLKEGGCVAVTEACWLVEDPPEPCRRFWAEQYPAITWVRQNLPIIEACGYEVLGHFALPRSCWERYYAPLEQRVAEVRQRYADIDDPVAAAVIEETETEIAIFREHGDSYGYVFFLMRRSALSG